MKKVVMAITIVAFIFGVLAVAEAMELKFAHFMSPKHIQHQKSFDPFCKKVAELTGGKVTVKIYPGGALGKPKQLPDAVKKGITDIAFIIPPYTTARFPRISVMDLPFLCDSAAHATKVIYAMWDKYFAEDFKDYKVLWLYSAGPGQFMSINKAMPAMADLKGMKMRSPTAYMSKLFKTVGANPVGMPIPKLTMSLQKKVIDGMLTPYSAVKDFRLFDLVKNISEANVYVTAMAVVMNKEKWNSLSDSAKKAIDQASGKQWGLHAGKVYDDHDQNTLKEIKAQGKIKVINMSDSEIQKIKKAVQPLENSWAADLAKKGISAKELLKATREAVEKTR